jgi:hypothetical protein
VSRRAIESLQDAGPALEQLKLVIRLELGALADMATKIEAARLLTATRGSTRSSASTATPLSLIGERSSEIQRRVIGNKLPDRNKL